MSKILSIIESGYRATLEEQDDTIVWITNALKGAGADISVLLRGNAVNYAVKGQDASGLSFGARKQTQPPRLDSDLAKIVEKGIAVYVVEDDVSERGLERTDLIGGLKSVPRSGLPALIAEYDHIWSW